MCGEKFIFNTGGDETFDAHCTLKDPSSTMSVSSTTIDQEENSK